MKYALLITLMLSYSVHAHHYFSESYDIDTLVTVEVEVNEFRFINPHPFFSARLIDVMGENIKGVGDQSQIWELQMDNRVELQELGFNRSTFMPGDKIIITAHPGSHQKNILYVKAVEHPRLGFRYEHNVRQLFELP